VIVVSPDIARTKAPLKKESERGEDEQNPQLSARWLREARAVASLSHPNVVAIYDVGESEGRLWLAMEYVVALRSETSSGTPSSPCRAVFASSSRSHGRSKPRTAAASSIAISSRRT